MFLPLADDNSDRKITPYVTYTLIAINVLVFAILQKFGYGTDFTYSFSTVPAEILTGKDIVTQATKTIDEATGRIQTIPGLGTTPVSVYLTLITSMFMHGGIAHIVGNMFYLFIFGDNIENRLGHVKYLAFYLLTGLIASLSHVFSTFFQNSNTLIPSLGASGAISGVMGAYMCMFPRNKVKMLAFYFIITVPAVVTLGIWIGFQILNGLGKLGGSGDGVAYGAHIGGFIAGFILIGLFDKTKSNEILE
jgi:membrane associated rhomboid family serine protease